MTNHFILLSLLRFIKLGLSVVSLIIYARTFGVGLEMDVWVFASGIVAAAGLLAWGPVNEIARSRFLQHVALEGFDQASHHATQLLKVSAVGSITISLILLIIAPWCISWLYVGTDGRGETLALEVFIYLLPSIVLMQMLALSSAYLNCCEVIYAPEVVGISAGFLSLGCVYFKSGTWGINALVVAHYLGLGLSLVISLGMLYRRGFLTSNNSIIGSSVRDYLHFALPLYVSYTAGQISGVLERSLAASLGTGAISSVNYASQIKSTLQAVLTSVLFSLAVPRLTKAVSDQSERAFGETWREVHAVVILFLVAVVPPLVAGSSLIVAVLFGSKVLNASQADLVAELLKTYVLALIPVSFYLVHGAALLAKQRNRAYAAWGLACQAIYILLIITFLPILGAQTFPSALLISHGIAAIMMAKAVGTKSVGVWKDLILFIGITFFIIRSELILFEWLFLKVNEQLATFMLGFTIHIVLVITILLVKRHVGRRSV